MLYLYLCLVGALECYLDLHLSLLLLFDYLRTWQWSFLMKALNL